MKALKGIKFLFSSRGFSRWVKRLISVNRRFGFSPDKQMNIIRQYALCLKEHGIKGNFFIPAVLLERYFNDLKLVDQETVEWGIHGWVHTDHSQLEYQEQKAQIQKAIDIFDRCNVPFTGFRCPYLKFNVHTNNILSEMGRFKFDSSDSIVWEEFYGSNNKNYVWIKEFYRAKTYMKDSARPYQVNRISEIPVSLPDDDVLLDRENLTEDQIFEIWKSILRACHRNNEVFVLQLHPERFLELKNALIMLIKEAKELEPKIWITTLGEVAKKKENFKNGLGSYQGAFCITGDIDAITINDFLIRLRDW